MLGKSQDGFSLIEVLLSGFILFLVITVTMLVYRGALFSSEKAENALALSANVDSIRRLISDGFQAGRYTSLTNGSGSYGAIKYQWEATLTHIGNPPKIISEISGLGDDLRYYLWNIKLKIQSDGRVSYYNFVELSR